ncbi:MAG: hypothetical protein IGS38_19890 [Synechococcales cyanobacterium M58_A2018_015]|nr:hypothetical protein [Synechococcales cyanobacterium M58_A2018_015]
MSLYQFTLKIDEIIVRDVTERRIARNTGRNKGDEVSFTTIYASSNDTEPSREKKPVYEDFIRLRKGDVKYDIDVLSTTIDLDANETVAATINVSDDDDINWFNFLEGSGKLGKAIIDGVRGIIARDPTAIVQAIEGAIKGSIELADALNEEGAETIASMNLAIQVTDGKPQFRWEGASDPENKVQTWVSTRFSEDNSVWFLAKGQRSEYRIRVTAQFDPATRQSYITSSLEDSSQTKLLLYGTEAIDGIGNSFDNALIGNEASNRLIGLMGQDLLNGDGGNDYLNGGEGIDSMFGGAGDDSYEVDHVEDIVVEYFDQGIDTINSTINYTLGENLENLSLIVPEAVIGIGNRADNRILGSDADNQLSGLEGDDHLIGGNGNDLLLGDSGIDILDGGAGIDTIHIPANEISATADLRTGTLTYLDAANNVVTEELLNIENVVGTRNNDVLIGNAANNQLDGGDGNDRLRGNSGDDVLTGGAGNDTLDGGAGIDSIDGGEGIDSVTLNDLETAAAVDLKAGIVMYAGEAGKEITERILNIEGIAGTALNDTLVGDDKPNYLIGRAGNDTLKGGAGDDELAGGDGIDQLDGGEGSDMVVLSDIGTDAVPGFPVDVVVDLNQDYVVYIQNGSEVKETILSIERVRGTALRDQLLGDEGDNRLAGESGDDRLSGGAGDDWLTGGDGVDDLDGGDGYDVVLLGDSKAGVKADLNTGRITYADAANKAITETIRNIESISSTPFADELIGNADHNRFDGQAGDDRLQGGNGNDYLIGGAGIDYLDGGSGFDTVNLSEEDAAIAADLTTGIITYINEAGETVTEIILNIEAVIGTSFDDVLIGNSGNNRLYGNGGNDRFTGGEGADAFGFSSPIAGTSTVTDFTQAQGDTILISARGFDPTLTGGALAEALFAVGNAASTADHRIIYDPATGALFFDVDGNGSAAQVQFATLSPNLALTHSDIGVTV